MRRQTAVLVVVLCSLHTLPASARTGPHFDEGQAQLRRFEYPEAIRSFQDALEWPGNTLAERATIHVYVGIAQCNTGNYDAAEASFKKALALDAKAALPPHTSPKIAALFERVRSESRAAAPPTPPPVAPVPQSQPADGEPRSSGVNWPAWLVLGVGAAALGTGVAMAVMWRSEKSSAEDKSIAFDEAQRHADAASTRGIVSGVMFGVAGAAAVTSGLLFYFGSKRQRDVSAAIVPSRSGAFVQLELRR
jgi:tetratricopeptide (TPR) repeat protein